MNDLVAPGPGQERFHVAVGIRCDDTSLTVNASLLFDQGPICLKACSVVRSGQAAESGSAVADSATEPRPHRVREVAFVSARAAPLAAAPYGEDEKFQATGAHAACSRIPGASQRVWKDREASLNG